MLYISALILLGCSYAIFKYGVKKLGTTLAATWIMSAIGHAILIGEIMGDFYLTNIVFIGITLAGALLLLLASTPAMYFYFWMIITGILCVVAQQLSDPGTAVYQALGAVSLVAVVLLRKHLKILTVGSISGLYLSSSLFTAIFALVGVDLISTQPRILVGMALTIGLMIGGILLQYKFSFSTESTSEVNVS